MSDESHDQTQCAWCESEFKPGETYVIWRGWKLHTGDCRENFIQEFSDD